MKSRIGYYSRSVIGMLGVRAASVTIGLLIVRKLTALLGVEGYGEYFALLTDAQFVSTLGIGATSTLVVREASILASGGQVDRLWSVMGWSTKFILVVSLLTGAIWMGLAMVTEGSGSESIAKLRNIAVAVGLAGVLGWMNSWAAISTGQGKPVMGSMPDSLFRPVVFYMLVLIWLSIPEANGERAMGCHIAAACFSGIVARHIAIHSSAWRGGGRPPRRRVALRATPLPELMSLSIATGAAMINGRLDVLMIGWGLAAASSEPSSNALVGVYGVALQVSGLVALGPTLVNNAAMPRMGKLYASKEYRALELEVAHCARMSLALSVVATFCVGSLGRNMIEVVAGSAFSAAYWPLVIMCLSRCLVSTHGPLIAVLTMTGNSKIAAVWMAYGAAANGLLNLGLMPIYGLIGAAIASLMSLQLVHMGMRRFIKKHLVSVVSEGVGFEGR